MAKDNFDPDLLKGFLTRDPKAVADKLQKFSSGTVHLVSDWDRTLTATSKHLDITSWGVVQKLLPSEALVIDKKLDNKFFPKEREGKLTLEEAIEWWHGTLKLHVRYGTNIHDIERSIQEIGLHPREGAVALFAVCKFAGIPTVILSAGIRNVITWIADTYGMDPTVILATQLHTDESGRVTGWEEPTLVHFLNKHEAGHKELSAIRKKQPHAILLGDTLEDAQMIDGEEDVIRIRICDSHSCATEKDKESLMKASFDVGYDLITIDSLNPVVTMVEKLASKN